MLKCIGFYNFSKKLQGKNIMASSAVNVISTTKSNWPLLNKANPFKETNLCKKITKLALCIITVPLALVFDLIRNISLSLCCCKKKKNEIVLPPLPQWKQYLNKAHNYIILHSPKNPIKQVSKEEKILAGTSLAISVALRDVRPALFIGVHFALNRFMTWINQSN